MVLQEGGNIEHYAPWLPQEADSSDRTWRETHRSGTCGGGVEGDNGGRESQLGVAEAQDPTVTMRLSLPAAENKASLYKC